MSLEHVEWCRQRLNRNREDWDAEDVKALLAHIDWQRDQIARLQSEINWLKYVMDCAETRLLADVIRERDELKAENKRLTNALNCVTPDFQMWQSRAEQAERKLDEFDAEAGR